MDGGCGAWRAWRFPGMDSEMGHDRAQSEQGPPGGAAEPNAADANAGANRRGFLSATSLLMSVGVASGYGTLAVMAGKFLYSSESNRAWFFATTLDRLAKGESMTFVTPAGAKIVIARQGTGAAAEDFIALSSVCPHLGCQVHWEPQNQRFFCPCHNGEFDPSGKPVAGPPAAAGQRLLEFPLRVEGNLLFIEAPADSVVG